MKYRPVAPEELDRFATQLQALAGQTVLPWRFERGGFVVDVEGKPQPVVFEAGDTETQLVELMTQALPSLLEALHAKYVIIDRDGIDQRSKSNA